jgi:hypothetical protein
LTLPPKSVRVVGTQRDSMGLVVTGSWISCLPKTLELAAVRVYTVGIRDAS